MIGFFKFLGGTSGRAAQGVLGGLLILLALYWFDTLHGAAVGTAGLVFLACGVFDVSAIAPLFGLPFSGPNLRHELLKRQLRPHARSSGNRLYR
ncbi:MAG: DUF2892 domain-containing protein [Chloroflexi bacterium]|nr:DUF2892 domain-containing protein [Chloroflexota bacterium]